MTPLVAKLEKLEPVDTMVIYGRAQAIAKHPELIRRWLGVVNERLLINCGMDSGDETMLSLGIDKSARKDGSRLHENMRAVLNIKNAGPKAHLHFSVIFGSPGETKESCERTMKFVRWAIRKLGSQLDVVEADRWWVNFGAPCAVVFHNYDEAVKRAALAGKTISQEEWQEQFAQYSEELSVPDSCQAAWYRFFTNITRDEADEYNVQVQELVRKIPDSASPRYFAFRPPSEV